APGSVWPTKRWPAVYWGKLIDKFAEEGYEVILIGSAQDSFLVEEISAHCSSGFLNGMGRFTLRQSAELIRRSQMLVSNDSAPTHMGVAVRSRVLTIFGPTVPAFGFYPYGEKDQVAQIEGLYCRPCSIHGTQKCPEGHFKCMLTLKPDMVFNIARKMLNECS
ncbi:MAG: glycosyltransferase family 9 protein, partial [Calditrichia bacterium]